MSAELPTGAASLVDLIGHRTALALMGSTDTGTIYIPLRPKPSNRLVQIVGIAAATRLSTVYGGRTIRIPLCASIRRAKRNAEIHRMAAAGMKNAEIARRFGMTDRTVRYVLAV